VPRKRKQTISKVSRLVTRFPAFPLVSADSVSSSLRYCRSSISSLKWVAITCTAPSRALHRMSDSFFTVHVSFSAFCSIALWILRKRQTYCSFPKKVMKVWSTEAACTPARFKEWLSQLRNFALAFLSRSLVCTPLI